MEPYHLNRRRNQMDISYEDLMTLDIPFCRKVLEYAQAEKACEDYEFDMGVWAERRYQLERDERGRFKTWKCATAACLAGTAVMLDPCSKLVFSHRCLFGDGDGAASVVGVRVGGQITTVGSRALELMGITDEGDLFGSTEDEALRVFADWIRRAEELQSARDYVV
jgi:hypothetical protein